MPDAKKHSDNTIIMVQPIIQVYKTSSLDIALHKIFSIGFRAWSPSPWESRIMCHAFKTRLVCSFSLFQSAQLQNEYPSFREVHCANRKYETEIGWNQFEKQVRVKDNQCQVWGQVHKLEVRIKSQSG